jgi:uncharacterized protein (DUF1015 family)
MALIAPLSPLRYDLKKVSLANVVAPPYDVISVTDRAELLALDPHNVVRLILPEGEGDARYANASATLSAWREAGVLVRDDEPGFYRYDQTFAAPGGTRTFTRTGFLALVGTHPYEDRVILPHERTLSGPKEDRLKLFRATQTNLSPGFMLYRDAARRVDNALSKGKLLAEFTTADGVSHALTKVSDPSALSAVVKALAPLQLLIADGHHRYETSLRYRGEVEASLVAPSDARREHRYFMVLLANEADPNLVVFATHRHVHSLLSFDAEQMVHKAREWFTVSELPKGAGARALDSKMTERGYKGFVVALPDGRCFSFEVRADRDLASHPLLAPKPAALRQTDVTLLHSILFEDILGISAEAQAKKTNLWYPQDAGKSLAELRAGKGQLLVLMNPTPVSEVREVAEAGEVMPQKSTFFYPKVLTGLAIHTLLPTRFVGG